MTPSEIDRIEARLDRLEELVNTLMRLVYVGIGLAVGGGALQISQLVGM